ncbi:MAG: hypothetical protein PVJ57_21640 [Phycisphaerae bacterium]
MDSNETAPARSHTFELEATRVLQQLRTALARVVAGIPGHVSKPAELQRSLNVDINLSCKVFRIVNAASPLDAGPHVPGLSGLRTFLKAAQRVGVAESLVSAAMAASGEFNRLVANHAGDRPAFDTMISAFTDSPDAAQIGLQHRRALFRGHRHVLGVQARVQMRSFFLQPAEDDRMLDVVSVAGVLGLRQLCPGAPLVMARWNVSGDDGNLREVQCEPLDSSAEAGLVPKFCSQPLPQYRTMEPMPGIMCGELVSNGLGKQAAITCVQSHVHRAAIPRYRGEADRVGAYAARVRIPSEVLLVDVLAREDVYGSQKPIGYTVSEHQGEIMAVSACAEWLRLKPYESVAYLGRGPSVLYTPDFPRSPELGAHVFERMGWDPERFDVYRCRVEYPIMPSTVTIQFDLIDPPTASAE